MRIIVVKSFRDIETRKILKVDEELEVSNERAQKLIDLGLAKAERIRKRRSIEE